MYIIITRPEHEIVTRYLSRWSKNFIKEAEKKGYTVLDLYRDKANKKELEGRIEKLSPSFLYINGHGNESVVSGHDDMPLVSLGKNEHVLADKITYAISCCVAKKLGISVCKHKNTTFIGYKKSFMFNARRKFLNNPTKDERAERCLNPANKVALALIKGHTAKEAVYISKKETMSKMKKLLPCADDREVQDDLTCMYWNMSHQVCLGNEDATV